MSEKAGPALGPCPQNAQANELLAMLHSMRKEQYLSQAQVAMKLCASRSHIAAIEKGAVVPRLDTYIKLLSLYGYELSVRKKT